MKIMQKGVERAVWIIVSIVVTAIIIAIIAASVYLTFNNYSATSSKKQVGIFSYLTSILPHLSSFSSLIFYLLIPAMFSLLSLSIFHSIFNYKGNSRKGMALQKIMYLLLVLIVATVLATIIFLAYKSLQKRGSIVNPKDERYAIECNVKCRAIVNENPEVLTTQQCVDVCIQNKGKISADMITSKIKTSKKQEGKGSKRG